MPTKQRKPINSSSRFQTHLTFEELTREKPEKSLTAGKHKSGGRNNKGQLTSWWRGGGHKRRYRVIDFKRDKHGVPAKVATIEYDPNRSARIALLHYADGEKRYILWPDGLKVGAEVVAGENVEVNVGNALPLRRIPLGTVIHNIELKIGKGGQMVRERRRRRPAHGARRVLGPGQAAFRAKCARCTSSATPPWARWATWITRTSRSARPGATAGWAGSRTTAASP